MFVDPISQSTLVVTFTAKKAPKTELQKKSSLTVYITLSFSSKLQFGFYCVCTCARASAAKNNRSRTSRGGGEYHINTKIDSAGGVVEGVERRSWHAQKIGSREQMVRRRKET